MVAIDTDTKASIASYFYDHGWLVTFENERDNIDEEYGMFVNEMATQCIESGYKCVELWMADGEPGGSVPQLEEWVSPHPRFSLFYVVATHTTISAEKSQDSKLFFTRTMWYETEVRKSRSPVDIRVSTKC